MCTAEGNEDEPSAKSLFEACLASDDDVGGFATYVINETASLDDNAIEIAFLVSALYSTVQYVRPVQGLEMIQWGLDNGIVRRYPEVSIGDQISQYMSNFTLTATEAAARWCKNKQSGQETASTISGRRLLDETTTQRLVGGDMDSMFLPPDEIPTTIGNTDEQVVELYGIRVVGEVGDRGLLYDETTGSDSIKFVFPPDDVFEKAIADSGIKYREGPPSFFDPTAPNLVEDLNFGIDFVLSGISHAALETMNTLSGSYVKAMAIGKGAALGAKLGTAIGSFFAGVGAPVGTAVGATIGAVSGYFAADFAMDELKESTKEHMNEFLHTLYMDGMYGDVQECENTYDENKLCAQFQNLYGYDHCQDKCEAYVSDRQEWCISWAEEIVDVRESCRDLGEESSDVLSTLIQLPKAMKDLKDMKKVGDGVFDNQKALEKITSEFESMGDEITSVYGAGGDLLGGLEKSLSVIDPETMEALKNCQAGAPPPEFEGKFIPETDPECQPGFGEKLDEQYELLKERAKNFFALPSHIIQLSKESIYRIFNIDDDNENETSRDDEVPSSVKITPSSDEESQNYSSQCRQVVKQGGLRVYNTNCLENASEIGFLEECEEFEFVTKGPISEGGQGVRESSCNDGFCWIQIYYNDNLGWTNSGPKIDGKECTQNDGSPPLVIGAHVAVCGTESCLPTSIDSPVPEVIEEAQCGELLKKEETCDNGGCRYGYSITVPANKRLVIRFDMYGNPDRLQVRETTAENNLVYDSGYQGTFFSCTTDKVIASTSQEGCRGLTGTDRMWELDLSPTCPLEDDPVELDTRSYEASYRLDVESVCPGSAFELLLECANEDELLTPSETPIPLSDGELVGDNDFVPSGDDTDPSSVETISFPLPDHYLDDTVETEQDILECKDYFMEMDNYTPLVNKACRALWTPGSVPQRVDAGIGAEITCWKDSYEIGPGEWQSPRPAVCDDIEAAAAELNSNILTPGCALYFWCGNPESGLNQFILQQDQVYLF